MNFAGKTLLAVAAAAAICPQLPAGTSVFNGSAVLDQATRATLTKNGSLEARFSSTANSAVLDWSKLNIPQGHTLGFDGSGTTFFNLVSATAGKSQIDGIISGNGSVWVINPSGVAFGANAQVDVGGLFAVAAGNLSNEAALRDGTALTPSFASFAGRVDVDGGAKFTADQVALLGKGVSAAGDYIDVNQLTAASADKLVVDEVAGGRISVSVSDFATEGTVELGDLLVGGDVNAVARGTVTASGEAYALGNVQLFSKAGDVTVASEATVETLGTGAEIGLVAGMADGATGNVKVDGTVKADAGEIYLHAGYGDGSAGSTTVNGMVSAGGNASALAGNYSGYGDNVTVAGTVSAGGKATLASYDGAVALSAGKVTGGNGVSVSAFAGVSGTGAIDASGKTLSVNGGIGDIALDGVSIKAKDATLTADDYVAYYGSDYAGAVSAKNTANDFTGTVTARGASVAVLDANDLALGDVKAYVGGVTAYSGNGDVSVAKGASVQSVGTVDLTAGMGTGAAGSVRVAGAVSSSGGDVSLYSGYGSGASGDVTIDGDVTAAGTVDAYAGFGYAQGTDGKLSVNGNVTAGAVYLRTGNGDIAIGGDAVVKSDAASYGGVYVYTAADAGYGILEGSGHSGNITVDGTLKADGVYGMVDVVAGKEAGATGSVTLNGTVTSDYYSELATRTGDITVNGSVSSLGNVTLNGESGDITVAKGAEVTSTGGSQGIHQDVLSGYADDESHSINILAAMDADGKGSVNIAGSVSAKGDLGFASAAAGRDGTTGELTGGSGDVTVSGSIQSSSDVVVASKDGTVSVAEGGMLDASSGLVGVTAGKDVSVGGTVVAKNVDLAAIDGSVSVGQSGRIAASASMSLSGFVGVSGDGEVDVAGGSLNIFGGTGPIALTGVVKAKDAMFTTRQYSAEGAPDSDVKVNNVANDFTGTVTAEGKDVSLADANDVTLGTVYASGKLNVDAGGDIRQQASTVIIAGGTDAVVAFSAGGDVTLANENNDFCGAVTANGAGVKLTDRNDLTLGAVTANAGSVDVKSVAGDIAMAGDVSAAGDIGLVAKKNVTGDKKVTAGGDLVVNSEEGNVALHGVLKANDVRAEAAKNVTLNNEANALSGAVSVKGSNVGVLSGSDVRIVSAEATDGSVSIVSTDGDVTVVSGGKAAGKTVNLKSQKGDVVVKGSVAASDTAMLETSGAGDVRVSGTVTAAKKIQAVAADGDVVIGKGAIVSATGTDGSVQLLSSFGDGSKGDIVVNGTVAADGLDGCVDLTAGYGMGASGDVKIGATGQVRAIAQGGQIYVRSGSRADDVVVGSGSVEVSGQLVADDHVLIHTADGSVALASGARIAADGAEGTVHIATGYASGSEGNVSVDGSVSAGVSVTVASAEGAGSHGDVKVSGSVEAGESVLVMAGYAHEGQKSTASGDVVVSGTVSAGKSAIASTGTGTLTLTGKLVATDSDGAAYLAGGVYNGARGDVRVDGTLASNGDAFVMTGASEETPGDIVFGQNGSVVAARDAFILTSGEGSVVQEGTSVPAAQNGQVANVTLPAAVTAQTVNFKVNGSIGKGESAPVAVDAKIFGYASGDASLAAANGKELQGGENPGTVVTAYRSFSWADLDANSSLEASGDLTVYAPGGINHYGNFLAGGDLTLSAAAMGDLSFLRADGTLRVNNVGKPANPLLAYFKTVNGVTPKIDNQPNDTVIFVDGRLAGGNIQTMNRLGSHEAFPVETPELKSVQGVFGNPNFLHGELDVAEPVGIGVIDYLLVDRARMSYGADIPPEMDMQVSVNGLSPLYSYWFGQRRTKDSESERRPGKSVVHVD